MSASSECFSPWTRQLITSLMAFRLLLHGKKCQTRAHCHARGILAADSGSALRLGEMRKTMAPTYSTVLRWVGLMAAIHVTVDQQ